MSEAVLQPPARGLPVPAAAALRRALNARLDDLRLALGALSGHKLRSGLTLLGIVIGVFTVVAMMALLNGLQKSINKQLGALGADAFQIQRWPAVQFGNFSPEVAARKKITLAQFEAPKDAPPQARQGGRAGLGDGNTAHGGPQPPP